ncbi:hypothetical protein LOTGIDRAFT_171417 [Lottia gigantea]|uniref:DDE Tnp4 domain-containing protein n=1 Tax=Lottia gigantea TaxID=225164 RepID=V4CMC9_LOTGI|nr:hypothetical protein LOTGIDRAFT_171417 [Lottia gigantea]ESP03480.1 hypothetical protein LOTGIDRAFT_171417 [Lottia gigantea]
MSQPNSFTTNRELPDYVGPTIIQVVITEMLVFPVAWLKLLPCSPCSWSIAPRFIKLPHPEEYADLTTVRDVDGNNKDIIRIQRPHHAGDAYFCGRHGKSCDSFNVQYVCDKFGRIRHVISGLTGSTHDKIAAEWSPEFMQYLHTLPNDVLVLGDPAYRNLHPSVMHTFTGANLTQQQLQSNTRTRQRQIVERTISATELKWRMTQMKENRFAARKGPDLASKCSFFTIVTQIFCDKNYQ